MSVVTNIILTSHIESVESESGPDRWPAADFLNDWLAEHHHGAKLVYVGDQSKGGKHMECDVWIGAFNYFPLADFLSAVLRAPWDDLDGVQVFVREQEDELFTERFREHAKA